MELFQMVASEVEILHFPRQRNLTKINELVCWLQKYLPFTHWRNCFGHLLVGLFDIEVAAEKDIDLVIAMSIDKNCDSKLFQKE